MRKLILPAILSFALTAGATQDPATPSDASADELSQLLLQQKEIIDAQAKELETLRERLSEVEALALSSHNRLEELSQQPAEASVSAAVEQRLEELEQQVQKIPEAPAEVVDVDQFPGSFRIPGTDAAIKVGGQVRMSVVKTLGPLGVDDKFVTSSIPIEGTQEAGKGSRLTYSARPSRLNFDFRTLTGVGSVRAFLEADFAGGSTNSFRLRHAYGQWGHWLGGQTWSTFADPAAEPDGIDFEGLNAISLFRQPQIRWTREVGKNVSLSIAAENPSPDVTGATGVNQAPDVVARIRLDNREFALFAFLAKGGHVQAAVLGRQIRAEPPDQTNTTVSTGGFGANVSGQMFTKWRDGRDNFTFAVNGGTGVGRYITDLGSLGGQDAVYDPDTSSLEPLQVFAPYVGFQHWWGESLRSTWTYGFVDVANPDIQTSDSLHQTHRWTANLAWSPILRLDLVFEYLAGTRENKDGESGFSNQLQIGGTFRF
jgi:uncharacterized coiled-coil protein SlyX